MNSITSLILNNQINYSKEVDKAEKHANNQSKEIIDLTEKRYSSSTTDSANMVEAWQSQNDIKKIEFAQHANWIKSTLDDVKQQSNKRMRSEKEKEEIKRKEKKRLEAAELRKRKKEEIEWLKQDNAGLRNDIERVETLNPKALELYKYLEELSKKKRPGPTGMRQVYPSDEAYALIKQEKHRQSVARSYNKEMNLLYTLREIHMLLNEQHQNIQKASRMSFLQ